jgi:curved DNA-binding protein CbpA
LAQFKLSYFYSRWEGALKSAYQILGVPGNASPEDIDQAFANAKAHYTPARIAESADGMERFAQVKSAYAILKDPASRAAHDRKLANQPPAGSSKTAIREVVEVEKSPLSVLLKWGVLALCVVFGIGFYMSHQRAQVEKARLLAEAAEKQAEAAALEKQRAAEAAEALARRQAELQARAQEQQLRAESSRAAISAANNAARSAAEAERARHQEEYAQRQRDAEVRQRQREAEYAASRARAEDQARIRSLCMTNYGRPHC